MSSRPTSALSAVPVDNAAQQPQPDRSLEGTSDTPEHVAPPTQDAPTVLPQDDVLAAPPAIGHSPPFATPSNRSFAESSQPLATAGAVGGGQVPRGSAVFSDKEAAYLPDSHPAATSSAGKRRLFILLGAVAAIVVIVLAIALPVTLVNKNKSPSSAQSNGDNNGGGHGDNAPTTTAPAGPQNTQPTVMGADGSTITTETGQTFVYANQFGGFWYADPNDPYNDSAQPQSWTPPLNQTWDYQNNRIRGVNLGGWLVPEPFIVPALYQRYQNGTTPAIDEWTLSQNMAADTANGGLAQLENHYATFITEQDFAQIAGAGLNWVRLPIPFFAIEKYAEEPFLDRTSWKYALKAFAWARKYGLRINLDLHVIPGSQNGYNHSGKQGTINWLYSVMGLANAQRSLDYLRVFTEFIAQPEYKNVVAMFGIVNEPVVSSIGKDTLTSFYLQAHDIIRSVTGLGTGNGPVISIHDGFAGLDQWADLLPGADRLALDVHPYLCFYQLDTSPLAQQITKPCTSWAAAMNTSWSTFGVSTAGEWSFSFNDCGLYVNGVGNGARLEGTFPGYSGPTLGAGACTEWNNWQTWDDTRKSQLQSFALASMDALQNWFFWTWKIGPSSVSGQVEAPLWSYSLGLQNGWVPKDPRLSTGVCGGGSPATPLKATMTGGAGSGQIDTARTLMHGTLVTRWLAEVELAEAAEEALSPSPPLQAVPLAAAHPRPVPAVEASSLPPPPTTRSSEKPDGPPHPDSHSSPKTIVPRFAGPVAMINSVLADSWNAMGNPTLAEFDQRPEWDPLRMVRRGLLYDIDGTLKNHNSHLIWPGKGLRLDFGLPLNMNVLAVKYGEFTENEADTIQEDVQRLYSMLPYDIYRWMISINAVDKSLLGSLPRSDPRVQTWFKLLTDAKAMCARYGNPVPAEYNELNVIMEFFQNHDDFVNTIRQKDKKILKTDVEALQRAWGV
ncbi:hypothetical protein FRB99_008828 [Tulasnella sp. 403]|nr:hypothetical protein FRB99_008828 [Tulasnella sp. 403]